MARQYDSMGGIARGVDRGPGPFAASVTIPACRALVTGLGFASVASVESVGAILAHV